MRFFRRLTQTGNAAAIAHPRSRIPVWLTSTKITWSADTCRLHL
ncbi:hypothetical protein [Halomicronema sp. CCY15110]|nr:hypothetical protein [Halomicronema sp. CCY15110]